MLVPIQVGTSMASSYKSLINLGKIFLRIFCIRNILQKNNFARAALFFVHFLAVVVVAMWNFLSSCTCCGENVLCAHKKFWFLFSCWLFFFFTTETHFHLVDRYHFLFSQRGNKIFVLFFQRKSLPLCFVSLTSSLSPFFLLSFASLSPTSRLSFSFFIFQIWGHEN